MQVIQSRNSKLVENGTETSRSEGEEGRFEESSWRQEEETQEKEGKLLHLHLQGHEAGPSRYWYLQQGYGHHELLRQ